jgi:hypothetical protein
MSLLTTFEASTRFSSVFCGLAATVRTLHTNLVAHEEALVILFNTCYRGFLSLEFLIGEREGAPGQG